MAGEIEKVFIQDDDPEIMFVTIAEQIMTIPVPGAPPTEPPKLALVGVVGALRPEFIPTQYSFGVAFGIRRFNSAAPHSVRFEIYEPLPADVLAFTFPASPPMQAQAGQALDSEDAHIIFATMINNINLKTQGRYRLRMYLDDVQVGDDFPIVVRKKGS